LRFFGAKNKIEIWVDGRRLPGGECDARGLRVMVKETSEASPGDRWTVAMKRLMCAIAAGLLIGCAPALLQGRVSTHSYRAVPEKSTFTVHSQNTIGLTDRNIVRLIEQKLTERGYRKVDSTAEAHIVAIYSYNVGQGTTRLSSQPDPVFGGHAISSDTAYPRSFEIALIDFKNSPDPKKPEIVWQAELRSSGSVSDMSRLAADFIDVIFEHYGTTVDNKLFFKVVGN
jgi:hypothetical protein